MWLKKVWKYSLQFVCHDFICLAAVKLLQFVSLISKHCVFNKLTQMPSLNQYENVTCDNCGTQTTKLNLARHKKRCSAGTLHCSQRPNFSTKIQNDLSYHIAKKHSAPKPDITFKCKLCYAEFPGFYALRQHRSTQHGQQMGFGASNIDVEDIVGDADDQSLREELESCKKLFDRYRNGEWKTQSLELCLVIFGHVFAQC